MGKARRQEAPDRKPSKPRSRKGIPNRKYAEGTLGVSRCPVCSSTARTKYYRKTQWHCYGIQPNGDPYTLVVLRYCDCKTCGTPRRDVSHEYPKV